MKTYSRFFSNYFILHQICFSTSRSMNYSNYFRKLLKWNPFGILERRKFRNACHWYTFTLRKVEIVILISGTRKIKYFKVKKNIFWDCFDIFAWTDWAILQYFWIILARSGQVNFGHLTTVLRPASQFHYVSGNWRLINLLSLKFHHFEFSFLIWLYIETIIYTYKYVCV